jgi:hypothetical protein
MNKYEKGLAALDELFANITAKEFEHDYLAAESGVGVTAEEYLARRDYTTILIKSDEEAVHVNSMIVEWTRYDYILAKKYHSNFSNYSIQTCANEEVSFQEMAA